MRAWVVCLSLCISSSAAADNSCKAWEAKAKKLATWKAPGGCTVTAPDKPTLATSAAKVLDCKGVKHGFDFAKHRLLIQQRTLSPATVGVDAYDDGKTVTLVSRQVASCPNDPRPMPVPSTILFVVDPKGERAFVEAACTVPRKCK